ncbi:MAG: carbohydrate ABC transporter permease [Candidatus Gastranaerophilales bacterium]|nr:carbohydrate ABC transporter permease [Candidatus Gastranaerophilales bacterium]
MIRNWLKSLSIHSVLIFMSILSLFPFLWLISTALKGPDENIFQYPPVFIPEHITFENFTGVWKQIPFLAYFWNSVIVAGFTVVLNLIFSALAAYPLARMEFKGKKVLFYLILATIMVPFQAIMLPIYLIVLKLNMVDTVNNFMGYLGLILPFAVNAFGIFLMRQAFMAIPKEMEEAAFVDGCNVFQIWWKVLIPMVTPTLAVLAIFTFIGSWGEFLWPSIVLTKKTLYTLPVGINDLQGMFSSNWRYIAAGSIISIIPIIIFFVAMQKYFVSGQNEGAVKG